MPSKVCHLILFYIAIFWPQLFLSKLGVFNTTWTLLKCYKLSKVGKNSLPRQKILKDFKDNSNMCVSSACKGVLLFRYGSDEWLLIAVGSAPNSHRSSLPWVLCRPSRSVLGSTAGFICRCSFQRCPGRPPIQAWSSPQCRRSFGMWEGGHSS